jgi:hypothetical protein
MRKVKYTIEIEDENGNTLSRTEYSKECDIPLKDEIDRHTYDGLRDDLDKLEKAVIGTRTGAEKEFVTSILQEDNEIKKKPKN